MRRLDARTRGRSSGPSRRGLLAAMGIAGLAGCSGLPFDGGSQPVTLDGAGLRALSTREAPALPETVPVDIEEAYLAGRRDRVRALLDPVPTPLGPDEIPNGAIREELAAMDDHARSSLGEAEEAPTRYEAMESLRSARSHARSLATAWRSIEADDVSTALFEEAERVHADGEALRDRVRYVGSDPVRAVLVHSRVEGAIAQGIGRSTVDPEFFRRHQETPVSIGELGGDIERARAMLDDAGYLFDRFTSSIGEPLDLGPTIGSAADALVGAIRAERRSLPEFDPDDPSGSVGTDVEETPAAWALRELHQRISYTGGIDRNREEGHAASLIVYAQEMLARTGGFASLFDRVAAGETFEIESVDDVASLRADAVGALRTALDESPAPALSRRLAVELAALIRSGDRELEAARNEVEASWIARDASRYLVAAAVGRALPGATDRTVEALLSED